MKIMGKAFELNSILRIFMSVSILFFFTNINAQVEIKKDGLTKISGQIINPTSGTIGVKFYRDFISRGEEVFDIPLEDDKFSISFQLNFSTPVFLIYEGEIIQLFLDPGDDLYVNCSTNGSTNHFTFAGKGAGKTRFLKNIEKVFPERNADYIFYELVEREAMDFRKFMDRLHQKMQSFYKSLPHELKKDFSKEFEDYIKADMDYWYAYNLLRYRIENPLSNGIYEPKELPMEYYSFLDNLLISNEKALINPNYLYFIDQYIVFRNHLFDSKSDVSFLTESLIVTEPSMLVFKEPNSPPILEEAREGATLKFLDKKTDYKSPIQIKNEIKEDYWLQVKSSNGQVGWVHAAGVELEFSKNEMYRNKFPFAADSKYRNVYNLFSGKTLYYILANDLYWNSASFSKEKLSEKLNDYIEINPYQNYDSILLYSIQEDIKVSDSAKPFVKIAHDIKFSTATGTSTIIEPSKEEITIAPPINNNINTGKGSEEKTEKIEKKKLPKVKYQPVREYVNIDPRPVERTTSLSSISGRIDFPTGAKTSLLLYSDPITLEEIVHELEINSSNNFELSLNLAEPTVGVFMYGKERVDVYLEPGDLMQIKFSGNNFLRSLQFAGKGSAHNNYLKEARMKFSHINKDARKQAETLQHNNYKTLLDKIKVEKNESLIQSKYAAQFSSRFKTYAQADIDYWFAYLMLNYPWEYGFSNDMDGAMKMPDSFYDFLQFIPIAAEDVLPNANYSYFLDQYIDYQSERDENKDLESSQLIDKYLKGESAAYSKAKKLSIACKRGKAHLVGNEIKTFIENNSYEVYNDVLRLVYNEAKGLQVGMDAPNFTLTDVNGNEVSLSDQKGKVVYLDFWATWCSPCLLQMKNSKEWKSKFKNKDVVFLYLSLDKNKKAWEKYVKSNYSKDLHLIAAGGDVYKSQIATLYKVKKLPAYFLIDKGGKIAFKPERGKNITRVEDKISELLKD